MFIKIFIFIIICLTVPAKKVAVDQIPDLTGYYIQTPTDGYQYMYNIGWSNALSQYVIVPTGQPVNWGVGRLNFINDTAVNIHYDNGLTYLGIITYEKDLPVICWHEYSPLICWYRLLSNVTRIHVIHMNHLDVGYDGIPQIGFINNILNIYFHNYLPRAALLAEQIRRLNPTETFVYTTHAWILSMFFDCPPNFVLAGIQLNCPTADELQLIEGAIRIGAITWQGGAMNMEYEWMDERALNYSLDLSVSLAKRFDVPVPCVISLRDVPGLPISMVQSLNKYFSQHCSHKPLVTVGVNPAVTNVDIPNGLFRWGTSDDSSVLATWHFGGYPQDPGTYIGNPGGISINDIAIVPQLGVGLAFAFRTDNSGPPTSIADIYQSHEILRQSYPGAQIISSSLQNFLEDVSSVASELDLFNRDISDSWLQGIISDPKRVQQYVALQRGLKTCFDRNLCQNNDPQLLNASRFSTKIPEHTWGLPSVNDQINYSNQAFKKVVNTIESYINCVKAWVEQREFFNIYLDTVRTHPAYSFIQDELSQAFDNVTRPNLENFNIVAPNKTFTLFSTSPNPIYVTFDKNVGSISNLTRSQSIYWTDENSQLATYIYITYNETDFTELAHTYMTNGYGKPNSTINAQPESRVWSPSLVQLYQSRMNENIFLALLNLPFQAINSYGGFNEIWLYYTFINESSLILEWIGLNKTATRLAEASMIKFLLPMNPSCSLNQYDTNIDVQQVARKSSFFQRGADSFSCQTTLSSNCKVTLNVKSYDTPMTCPILKNQEPTALPFPAPNDSAILQGMAYNLHNNVWDTNYIFWYPYVQGDESWRTRYLITFDGSCN